MVFFAGRENSADFIWAFIVEQLVAYQWRRQETDDNTRKHHTFLFITSQFMLCTCYISCCTLKYLRQTRSRLNLIEFWWDVKFSGFHCVGQWGSVLYLICWTADHVQKAKWRDTIILHYGKKRNQAFLVIDHYQWLSKPSIFNFLGTPWIKFSDGVFKILFCYNICERQLQVWLSLKML